MKAVLCERFGTPDSLVLADIPRPSPGPRQVAIAVRACGINFPDVLMIEGKYQNRPDFPFSPGGEIAGIVSAVGEDVAGFRPGDHVIARVGNGGLREETLAQAERCVQMPKGLDFTSAAALLLTYGTAHYAFADRAKLQPGETVVILGAGGGLGVALIDLALLAGARVIACASSEEKLALARERGAHETVLYPATAPDREQQRAFADAIKTLTNGQGANVICDPVGGGYAEPALRAIAWEGRYLTLGFTAGIPSIAMNLALLKGCDVRGVNYGEFVGRNPQRNAQILRDVLEWAGAGRIRPYVSATFPLSRSGEAIAALASRRALGKLVVVVPG